jgi:hypothetical protein
LIPAATARPAMTMLNSPLETSPVPARMRSARPRPARAAARTPVAILVIRLIAARIRAGPAAGRTS